MLFEFHESHVSAGGGIRSGFYYLFVDQLNNHHLIIEAPDRNLCQEMKQSNGKCKKAPFSSMYLSVWH
jgi:hypothetical protein